MNDPINNDLTDKQRRYVEGLARGLPSRDAAKAAGYSRSYAMVAAHRLKSKPAVVEALANVRREGMKMASYSLVEAMAEADAAAQFARQHKNPMAVVKAAELRAKLSGLLIDRVEVFTADLRGALDEAKLRVVNAIALPDRGSSGKDH
jgi:phage terminase small subunit